MRETNIKLTTTKEVNHSFFVAGKTITQSEVSIDGITYLSDSVINEETNSRLHLLKRPKGKCFYYCESDINGYSKPNRISNDIVFGIGE